ncbi:MAG TPA: GNAT family N-acetyltransferase [Acidimicrobiia bacterium]
MDIRTATLDDLDEVVALWREFGGPSRSTTRPDHVRALIERDPDALLLAMDDSRSIVGSLVVGWDGWRCHLYRLAVRSSDRRAGVASALVAHARTRARAVGADRMDAMVHRDNFAAASFWEALGFELQDDDGRWAVML